MALWTPHDDATLLAKIAAWLDFSDAATYVLNGSSQITSITDKAQGRVFTPTSAAPGLATLDGKSALVMGSPLECLDALTYPAGGTFVGVTFGPNESDGTFTSYMSVGNSIRTMHINPRGALLYGYGNIRFAGVTFDQTTDVFSMALPVGQSLSTTLVHVDGQLFASTSGANATRTFSDLASEVVDLIVGAGATASIMGECFFVAADLTVEERQKLEGYLAHKWNTALVSGHPYETTPPQSEGMAAIDLYADIAVGTTDDFVYNTYYVSPNAGTFGANAYGVGYYGVATVYDRTSRITSAFAADVSWKIIKTARLRADITISPAFMYVPVTPLYGDLLVSFTSDFIAEVIDPAIKERDLRADVTFVTNVLAKKLHNAYTDVAVQTELAVKPTIVQEHFCSVPFEFVCAPQVRLLWEPLPDLYDEVWLPRTNPPAGEWLPRR